MGWFEDRFVMVVGAIIAVGAAWLGAGALKDALRFKDAPLPQTVEQAVITAQAGRQWVTVRSDDWRCDETKHLSIITFIPTGRDALVARSDHPIDCARGAAVGFTGVVELPDASDLEQMAEAGLRRQGDPVPWQLQVCESCGRDNARLGVVICLGFMLLGVSLGKIRGAIGGFQARFQQGLVSAAREPPNSAAANDKVRLYGFVTAALGGLMIGLGRDWVIAGLIPLQWFGGGAVLLGCWMLAFPEKYRELLRKYRQP